MEQDVVLLGQRITAARNARGWSRSDLARKAQVDPSYVTRIEEAHFKRPSVDKVRALAGALGINVNALTDPTVPNPDEDAQRRRLIEAKVGDRAGADFIETLIERVRGRPSADFETVLSVVDVLLQRRS
jgi:transcriptional regulator with XRE-family HTH domain